jgi:hypothetical protein
MLQGTPHVPALRNLSLVGCVLSVPSGVLQHIALNDRREERSVVAHTKVVLVHLVLAGHLPVCEAKITFLLTPSWHSLGTCCLAC